MLVLVAKKRRDRENTLFGDREKEKRRREESVRSKGSIFFKEERKLERLDLSELRIRIA